MAAAASTFLFRSYMLKSAFISYVPSCFSRKHAAILKKRDEYSEEFKALVRQDAENLMDIKHIKGKIQTNKKLIEDCHNEVIFSS